MKGSRGAIFGAAIICAAFPAIAWAAGGGERTEWKGEQVADIQRVDALFDFLAIAPAGADVDVSIGHWFENRGISANSEAARDLLARAQAVTTAHSRRVPEEVFERFRAKNDDAGFVAWQLERERSRFAELGRSFGAWLKAREEEGYAIAPLIDRLLSDLGVTMFSDDPAGSARNFAAVEAAFRQGMRATLGSLPPQFEERRPR